MAKKGKMKISKVKRNNHTTNKMKKAGTLRLQRHRHKIQKQKQPTQPHQVEYSSDSDSATGDEWADMLDEEEQQYIMSRLAKQPQLLSNVPEENVKEERKAPKRKRSRLPRPAEADSGADSLSDSDVEGRYEKEQAEKPAKKLKALLPIKTKEGLMERSEEVEESESEPDEAPPPPKKPKPAVEPDSDSGMEATPDEEESTQPVEGTISSVQLLAARRDKLAHEKLRIGALCSSLLESPEKKMLPGYDSGMETMLDEGNVGTQVVEGIRSSVQLLAVGRDKLAHEKLRIGALYAPLLESPEKKLKNLYPILYLMEERLKDGALNLHSIRKLATLSACEVFRDILPDYMIRHQDYSEIKLKKDTLSLYKYEKELLDFYKRYLQRLEKASAVLRRKKGDTRKPDESTISLAIVSLQCMCNLLVSRPQFNYSTNIAQSVVPFLDCRESRARDIVTKACVAVFADDNKGDITLSIVRLINQLVKRRGERLVPSALDCLLTLRIRDVDLDVEADLKNKKKQEEKHKKRIVNLSKKEKKRSKKLKEVERELLETAAQESAVARRTALTEVTKTVFHIYFRLLKQSPRSALLAAALDGLAKFTHVINLEYYSDLVAILGRLLTDPEIGSREKLLCVRTVLCVLAGSGDSLNVDPARFHHHLYANMLAAHAGNTHENARIILEAITQICARARRVSVAVLQSFAKRLCTLAVQLQHNGALACLVLLHQLAQQSKAVSMLLETDEPCGSGRYDPFSPSPEHSNAHAAKLTELAALAQHYHPTVREAALAVGKGTLPQELMKLSPIQVFNMYDGSQMSFKPAIQPPKETAPKQKKVTAEHNWSQPELRTMCLNVEKSVELAIR